MATQPSQLHRTLNLRDLIVYGLLFIAPMARNRRLPKILSTVDDKSGVPRVALLIPAAITLLAAVWAAQSPHGLQSLVSIVDIGALTAFLLLDLSVIGWYVIRSPHHGFSWWKHLLIPILGLVVIGNGLPPRTISWISLVGSRV